MVGNVLLRRRSTTLSNTKVWYFPLLFHQTKVKGEFEARTNDIFLNLYIEEMDTSLRFTRVGWSNIIIKFTSVIAKTYDKFQFNNYLDQLKLNKNFNNFNDLRTKVITRARWNSESGTITTSDE